DDQEVMRLGMDNYYAYCAEIGIWDGRIIQELYMVRCNVDRDRTWHLGTEVIKWLQ
ncbi:hypothetical protein Tco_0850768, partial [Tanacetum coccineum]